jgi:hypothetical protein
LQVSGCGTGVSAAAAKFSRSFCVKASLREEPSMKAYWSKLLENGLLLALFTGVAYFLTYFGSTGR